MPAVTTTPTNPDHTADRALHDIHHTARLRDEADHRLKLACHRAVHHTAATKAAIAAAAGITRPTLDAWIAAVDLEAE